jgi:hypothetical protein
MDDRSQRILVLMMYDMLEIDWWKHPAAQDIPNGLDAHQSIRTWTKLVRTVSICCDSFEELQMDSNVVEPSFKGDGNLL